MEIREKIQSGRFYHICTRSNGTDLLFRVTHDYNYFMDKCRKRLSDAWELIAWVMIPNEVHLIVHIKDGPETDPELDHSNLFGHVLNGYVQHYNRRYIRSGSLLNRSFRRESIKSDKDLKKLICQLDNLPAARGLVAEAAEWRHGSFYDFHQNGFKRASKRIVQLFGEVISYITDHCLEGMMKANMLPRRMWSRRSSFSGGDPLGGNHNPP